MLILKTDCNKMPVCEQEVFMMIFNQSNYLSYSTSIIGFMFISIQGRIWNWLKHNMYAIGLFNNITWNVKCIMTVSWYYIFAHNF